MDQKVDYTSALEQELRSWEAGVSRLQSLVIKAPRRDGAEHARTVAQLLNREQAVRAMLCQTEGCNETGERVTSDIEHEVAALRCALDRALLDYGCAPSTCQAETA